MKVVRTVLLVAGLVATGPLYAQVCSGGANGGTDATGNQCTDPGSVPVHAAASDAGARPAAVATGKPKSAKVLVAPTAASASRTVATQCSECPQSASGTVYARPR